MSISTTTNIKTSIPLFSLFAANAISMIGNVLAIIAIPWFVLQTTGSASKTGLTAFFTILPTVLAAFLGGSIVDRLGFKRASIIADWASTFTIGLIPLLFSLDILQFWQLLALVFVGNLLDAPGTTAREALIPDLAELAKMPLEKASSADQIIERSSRLIGAPLSGLLIALIGASQVLWVDAATFGVSALIITLAVPNTHLLTKVENEQQSYIHKLTTGFRFIWKDRLIFVIVYTVMITNMLDASLSGVIFPVYIKHLFGSAFALGLIFAASGGGAVIGAIIFGAVGYRLPKREMFVICFVITGFRFIILALTPPLWIIILANFISGVAAGPLNPIIATIEYTRIPATMRGSVFGTIFAGVNVASPLGVVLAGFLVEGLNMNLLLLIMGSIYILICLSVLFNPASKEMNSAVSKG